MLALREDEECEDANLRPEGFLLDPELASDLSEIPCLCKVRGDTSPTETLPTDNAGSSEYSSTNDTLLVTDDTDLALSILDTASGRSAKAAVVGSGWSHDKKGPE